MDIKTGAAVLTVDSRTQGPFCVLVDVDDWERVNAHRWRILKPKGSDRIYFKTYVKGAGGKWKTLLLHRVIMDAPTHLEVDHIHHNYCDLRKTELRVVTRKQNQENTWKPITRRTSSRFRGVYRNARSGKWFAGIKHEQKSFHIGTFPGTPEGEIEAARAFDRKALELFTHATSASINFPIEDYQRSA